MTSLVQVKVDRELKEEAEKLFNDLGLDITTALRMFLKAAVREQRIPFKLAKTQEVSFYSKENIAEIKRRAKELDEGKGIAFSFEEFEEFSEALKKAKTKEEREALRQRAEKGWSNV